MLEKTDFAVIEYQDNREYNVLTDDVENLGNKHFCTNSQKEEMKEAISEGRESLFELGKHYFDDKVNPSLGYCIIGELADRFADEDIQEEVQNIEKKLVNISTKRKKERLRKTANGYVALRARDNIKGLKELAKNTADKVMQNVIKNYIKRSKV